LPGAAEDYPFGDGVAVLNVGGRMFTLVSLEGSRGSLNLKCDPEVALEWPARYSAVRPGYHQDKPTGTPSISTNRSMTTSFER
jgi:predicted DNA-binding protein (MmcQ/YjbR family)